MARADVPIVVRPPVGDIVTAVRKSIAETFARLAVHSQLEVERRALDTPERWQAVAYARAYRHAASIVSPLGDVPAAGDEGCEVITEWRASAVSKVSGLRKTWTGARDRAHAERYIALALKSTPDDSWFDFRVDSRLVVLWPVDDEPVDEWARYEGAWVPDGGDPA